MHALDRRAGNTSSRVRSPTVRDGRLRVRAYLMAQAPLGEALTEALTAQLLEGAGDTTPERCVAHAQAAVAAWCQRALSAEAHARDPEGVSLRRALHQHPGALLSDDPLALEALQHTHAELCGKAELPSQQLGGARPWWSLGPLLLAGIGACGGWAMTTVTGTGTMALAFAALFGVLLTLHGVGALLTVLGLVTARPSPEADGPLPLTAVVMPIYEEDPERVFAALAAMRGALLAEGHGDAFEIFVASDTRDPRKAADEMRAWRRLAIEAGDRLPVFYRRRPANVGKKAGNLAELFVRHEHRYRYAIVLDADSLMGASTMVRMVRRMEAQPKLGLLQASIALRGGETLFARMLQMAHALGGPLLTRGLATWCGPDGNYFGHNAILRVSAFVRCCGLPLLSGAPPLGGPILSHDFVEAALLRRGGFEVRLAPDLTDSYEEPPPTLREYLVRDRRWCQGNLQHLRVVLADGLPARSRTHLLLGAMAYLASPLWLLFTLLAGFVLGDLVLAAGDGRRWLLGLAAGAFALLLMPRVVGLLPAIARARAHGGVLRLLTGFLLELVLSVLLAPILMVARTLFVLEIVTGRAVGWAPQRRRSAGALAALDGRTLLISVAGLFGLALSTRLPHPWLVWPLAAPCAAAIPLALLLGADPVGRWARRLGLFRVPEEQEPSAIARALESWRGYYHADAACRFRDLVLDPDLCARLRAGLPEEEAGNDPEIAALVTKAIERGPAGLSDDERQRISSSRAALGRLHEQAWRHWNVEDWELPQGIRWEPPAAPGQRPSSATHNSMSTPPVVRWGP